MGKKIKEKKNKYNSLIKELKDLSVVVENRNLKADLDINIFDELLLNNPENPAEVVAKMNEMSSFFWYLGSAKVELEDKERTLIDDFNDWLETKKSRYDGNKEYNSEAAKERRVMVKFPKTYKKYKVSIRNCKYILRKIDVARKSYDKCISLLQSIGSMIRADLDVPAD